MARKKPEEVTAETPETTETAEAAARRPRERILQRLDETATSGADDAAKLWTDVIGGPFNGLPAAKEFIGKNKLEGKFRLITVHDELTATKVVPEPVIQIV